MDKLHMSLDQLSKLNRQKAAPETSNKSGDAGAKGNNNNNSNNKNKKNTDNRKSNDNSNNNARGNNNNRSKGREGAGGAPGGSRGDRGRARNSGGGPRGERNPGGFRGRGGRGGGPGSGRYYDSRPQGPTRRPQAALPPVSEHANEIELSRDDKDTVKIAFRGKPLLDVKKSGLIVVQCPEADRDEDALMVANMALRPLALQLINVSGSQHDKEQWYVTDGRDYKVKCLEQGALGGPESLNATKHLRANVLAELDGENLLFRKWGSNRNVTTVLNAVTKLYKICVQNHWQKPHFHYDRKFVDDKPGFVFSVSLPEFSIEVPKDQRNNWDADMRVAKNKAALKALEIVEKLQPAAAAAPAN
ncbi:Hypothetical Protein FCC1311_087512 [Hondaea fermentalgiana]|uniref:Uncharacterized protein n=1 Tax=Hondaea fermentalgiana TaxID=2315210 RepID=A0A2R5GNQ9_9STRA|nr:Hypothetical Protein FCC1311_087512 [Hondaea fermentalgiana]|eukprot:GBG32527.1 Hypothetical Protein FCC1311_087512 [Hondaea fermentalgiana]